jgi:hypothetical protein
MVLRYHWAVRLVHTHENLAKIARLAEVHDPKYDWKRSKIVEKYAELLELSPKTLALACNGKYPPIKRRTMEEEAARLSNQFKIDLEQIKERLRQKPVFNEIVSQILRECEEEWCRLEPVRTEAHRQALKSFYDKKGPNLYQPLVPLKN